jgi:hypothetical protein
VAEAFDGQAEKFERGPVQTDPAGLQRLVALAALPAGAHVLDRRPKKRRGASRLS